MKYFFYSSFLFLLFSCTSTPNQPSEKETIVEKEELPPRQKLETVNGIPVYDFNGLEPLLHIDNDTTYIVNFWATWCKPCVEELPYFEEAHEAYKNEKVKVLLVSMDFRKQLEKKLIPFISKNNLQSEVVVLSDPDANSWIDKVSPEWGGAIPATLIYKKNKRDFYTRAFENFDDLNSIIQPYLKK